MSSFSTQNLSSSPPEKLVRWAEEILRELENIQSGEEAVGREMALHRLVEEQVEPVARLWGKDPHGLVEGVRSLCHAVEQLLSRPAEDPSERRKQRVAVSVLRRRVQLAAHPELQNEVTTIPPFTQLRDWPWRTTINEGNRIAFDAGGGYVVPLHGDVGNLAKPWVLEQALSVRLTDPPEMRPLDARGNPGGLIRLSDAERLIVVGDLHGRFDNLEIILKDKDNWSALKAGEAHLVFTGDAIHPRRARNQRDAYEDSFRVMFLIMTLRAENFGHVHYLIGNHENAHAGGHGAGKEDERMDHEFAQFIAEKFGQATLDRYTEFIRQAPVCAKVKICDEYVILAHAGLSARILDERGLINIFLQGRKGPALEDVLWAREFHPHIITQCLARVGGRLLITGHTHPSAKRAEKYGITVIAEGAFGHVAHKQLFVSSQSDNFGYLNLSMRRPLPADVTDLKAPDGRPAYRVFRIKPPEPEKRAPG